MHLEVMPVGAYEANCVVLWQDAAQAWVVDPGGDAPAIQGCLRRNGLTVAIYVATHGHIDHLGALDAMLASDPAPVWMHADDAAWAFLPLNRLPPDYPAAPRRPADLRTALRDGTTLAAGGLEARVLCTPGHAPGAICLHLPQEKLLITGDTLFAGSVGRTDLPGGDGRRLAHSLAKLLALPDDTRIVPGHGETTTLGAERRTNPYLRGRHG